MWYAHFIFDSVQSTFTCIDAYINACKDNTCELILQALNFVTCKSILTLVFIDEGLKDVREIPTIPPHDIDMAMICDILNVLSAD